MKRNTRLYKFVLCLLAMIMSGCGYNVNSTPHSWLNQYDLVYENLGDIGKSTSYQLRLCVDFGCKTVREAQLTRSEISSVKALFHPQASSPEQERSQIASAIALLESQLGPKVGTQNDLAQNSFQFEAGNQLDCIAETGNTSLYLVLLTEMQLLRFHRPTGRAHRGPMTFHLPHNTAVIKELTTNQAYVVDSWYHANGEKPWITGVEHWLSGASPSH